MTNEPSYSLSIRIQHVRQGTYRSRRRHDLREGPQPQYVDSSRSSANSVIMAAPNLPDIRKQCEERRNQRKTQRAMRSDAAIATAGIITWGRGLQAHVQALAVETQNDLYKAVSEAVAEACGSTIAGLVAHRDETAPHAHLWMPAITLEGIPISKHLSRRDLSRLQDVAMEAAKPWLPMIEPPDRKADRIARGDDASQIYNRSVAQLHADLPLEIEQTQNRLKELQDKVTLEQAGVAEMQERVINLEKRENLTEKEEKRLKTYRRRLIAREMELEDREQDIEAITQKSVSVAVGAVAAVIDGRIKPGAREKTLRVDAELQSELRPIWKIIAPTLQRLSNWWENFRHRVEALPEPEQEAVTDGAELGNPYELTLDYPDPKPRWAK